MLTRISIYLFWSLSIPLLYVYFFMFVLLWYVVTLGLVCLFGWLGFTGFVVVAKRKTKQTNQPCLFLAMEQFHLGNY